MSPTSKRFSTGAVAKCIVTYNNGDKEIYDTIVETKDNDIEYVLTLIDGVVELPKRNYRNIQFDLVKAIDR